MYCVTTVQDSSRPHRVEEELKADGTILLHTVLYTDMLALQISKQHLTCLVSHLIDILRAQ